MKPIDQSTIRKQNVRRILDLLSRTPSMTRQELAEATGLSLMTVSNLVDLLKSHDLLTLTPIPHSKPRASGRKAESIRLSGEKKAWLILEINPRKFRFTLMGFDQSVLARGSRPVDSGDGLECLRDFAHEVRDRIVPALAGRELLGAAILSPDAYESATDTIQREHLPEWLGYTALKRLFREELGPFHYIADKDVKYAVRAFSVLMEHSDCEVLYYLYIGQNFGGAVVHNGSLLYGLNNVSGDAGQMRDEKGESYEHQLTLGAFAAAAGLPDAGVETLRALADSDPERYLDELLRFVPIIADILARLIRVFDPQHIVIDCRYALPFERVFLESLSEEIEARHTALQLPTLSLVPATVNTVLTGAVHALQLEWIEHAIL